MTFLRPVFAILFAFTLALTGQSMAVTRGASDATGQMVLCTGTGPVTIYMDADGKPTAAPHICPDCLASALDMLAVAQPAPLITVQRPLPAGVQAPVTAARALISGYLSRAPPHLV